jgi:hypothetical protein
MDVPSYAPLFFPSDPIWVQRGSCGKKNCVATIAGEPGTRARTIHFGGSGKPEVEAEVAAAGNEVPWLYNNMIGRLPDAGWVAMRLDPERPSTSRLAEVTLSGRTVTTVESIQLFFRVSLPGGADALTPREPLDLKLVPAASSTELMAFESAAPWDLTDPGSDVPLRIERCRVSVTPEQHLSFEDVVRDGDRLSFRVRKDVGDVDGPVVWFVHDPRDPTASMPFAELAFDGDVSEEVVADVSAMAKAERLYLEATSIRDERHLWTMVKA